MPPPKGGGGGSVLGLKIKYAKREDFYFGIEKNILIKE